MEFDEILNIIKTFFDAILKIFKSLGINLGGKEEETEPTAEE